jgi:hypothetical protein
MSIRRRNLQRRLPFLITKGLFYAQ